MSDMTDTMPPETRAALEASIRHWQENVAAKTPGDVSVDGRDCALCGLFFLATNSCVGCPVMARSGRANCLGSPYHRVADVWWMWRTNPDDAIARTAWTAAAQAELDFLISLRDPT